MKEPYRDLNVALVTEEKYHASLQDRQNVMAPLDDGNMGLGIPPLFNVEQKQGQQAKHSRAAPGGSFCCPSALAVGPGLGEPTLLPISSQSFPQMPADQSQACSSTIPPGLRAPITPCTMCFRCSGEFE